MSDSSNLVGVGPLPRQGRVAQVPLRRQVFEQVRAAGRLPRVEIARNLGVSPASVGAVVAELLSAGTLREVDAAKADESVRGRPAVSLAVRAEVGLVAGIKLSGATHSAVLHDFSGRSVAEFVTPHRAERMTVDQIVEHADRLLGFVVKRAGARRTDILAVGLGVPGFVDEASGCVHWSPLIEGSRIPLRAAAADRLGLPVAIDNDANLVTLAELWFGDGRTLADFAVVTIEDGVGMGLVIGGDIYRGARGLGTELGHTKVQLDGAPCRCGQRGCLEAYVADFALVRDARARIGWVDPGLDQGDLLERLHARAKSGDTAARAIFRRAGRYLALALGNVVNLFDPELILLSGERMRYDYLYAEEILAEVAEMAIRSGRPAPRIEIHAWNDMVWARGAAALALAEATALMIDQSTPDSVAG